MSAVHTHTGAIAQLGEHLLCKQGVVGSIPTGSTTLLVCGAWWLGRGQAKSKRAAVSVHS